MNMKPLSLSRIAPHETREGQALMTKRMTRIGLALGAGACVVTSLALGRHTLAKVPQTQAQPAPSQEPVAVPGVRAKLIGEGDATRTYQLVLAPGTEAMKAISDF